jgi:hypothetical protein
VDVTGQVSHRVDGPLHERRHTELVTERDTFVEVVEDPSVVEVGRADLVPVSSEPVGEPPDGGPQPQCGVEQDERGHREAPCRIG